MVTPAFSADCADVEHANHEAYARTAVLAYWRHMPTVERRQRIDQVLRGTVRPAEDVRRVKAEESVLIGGTSFEDPAPSERRFLGGGDLYMRFDGTIFWNFFGMT